MWTSLRKIKDTWSWGRFAWQLAGALGVTGLISSVGGAVWAVILGVPTPIALMVGYCTLVGAVYLAMAPLAYRALAQSPSNKSVSQSKTAPDYKAWGLVKLISLGDAAHLWCDHDPHVDTSAPEIETWLNVFKDAVRSKELRVTLGDWADSGDIRQATMFPDAGTRVKRSDLSQYAKAKGYDPRFLRDV
jgi:hypothetical protein